MKKRVIALLILLLLLPFSAYADDDEEAMRLREEKLNACLVQALGENWNETLVVYEDYYLGQACEDGTLFAVTSDGSENTLHVVEFEDGALVSHVANPHAVWQDEMPVFAFEIENEIGLAYPSGDWMNFSLNRDGQWMLSWYCAASSGESWLNVDMGSGEQILYSEYVNGVETEAGEIAALPLFKLNIAEIDVASLPRDAQTLLSCLDASDGLEEKAL